MTMPNPLDYPNAWTAYIPDHEPETLAAIWARITKAMDEAEDAEEIYHDLRTSRRRRTDAYAALQALRDNGLHIGFRVQAKIRKARPGLSLDSLR